MKMKFIRIFAVMLFLAGFLSSALCLACGPRIIPNCHHNKTQAAPTDAQGCLAHCAKQKVFAVNVESRSLVELNNHDPLPIKSTEAILPQAISASLRLDSSYYINELFSKLNTSRISFTPLFNHAPPFSL